MTRTTIKEKMIDLMAATVAQEIVELIEDEIDNDTINEFLWTKDYGKEFATDYFEFMKDELIEEYLNEIYEDISLDDIDAPW